MVHFAIRYYFLSCKRGRTPKSGFHFQEDRVGSPGAFEFWHRLRRPQPLICLRGWDPRGCANPHLATVSGSVATLKM